MGNIFTAYLNNGEKSNQGVRFSKLLAVDSGDSLNGRQVTSVLKDICIWMMGLTLIPILINWCFGSL